MERTSEVDADVAIPTTERSGRGQLNDCWHVMRATSFAGLNS